MATNILMPALSPTMTEGTLARWLKREGDAVRSGDVIAEIETDKATMEVEAAEEGVIGRILVADGTAGVKVNAPIAVLIEEGEAPPDGAVGGAGANREEPAAPRPAGVDSSAAAPSAARQQAGAPSPSPPAPEAARLFASPLARRIAGQKGIDLAAVKGSGPHGRIIRADVESCESATVSPAPALAASRPAAPDILPPPAPVRPAPVAVAAPHRLAPNNAMRRTIARRLSESKQFVPHFYVSADIELDALLKLRAELNGRATEGAGAFRLSVNDMLVKAAAVALRRVPGVNASYTDEATIHYDEVDISVAVAIPDGLITPIIRQADRKGLAAISNEAKELIARARAGRLKPEEFQGGGFSISNLGMYGVKNFSAIINPPQGGILAVGAGEQRAVVKDGALAVATVMGCTLSVDHRVIDGALAAEWLQAFKRIVQDPLTLML